jgi:hypothetical protein
MTSLLKMWIPVVIVFLILLVGCSDPGPAEEVGEDIDETVQEAEDAIDPPGPAERTGRGIDEAAEDAGDAIDETTGNRD